jgi:polyisoprenoid-binding protein YceI
MRSLVFFAVGVVAAAVGLCFLFPERVQFVAQVADDHAVREPPRPLEDDRTAVQLARLERSLAALQQSLADAEARRTQEARAAEAIPAEVARQIAKPEPAPPPVAEPPPAPPPRTLFRLIEDGSKVGFDGSSNLHDFTGATTAVKGDVEFRLDQQADAPRAYVEIDARTLDTGNQSRDKEMHGDYLESAKWTTMSFKIESLVDLKPDGATRFQARARGTFTCHGKEKQVEAPFKAERVGATGLRIEGELPLKMSDFGITPPTAMGGLIRTHDDVRVWFVLQGRSEP